MSIGQLKSLIFIFFLILGRPLYGALISKKKKTKQNKTTTKNHNHYKVTLLRLE